MAGESQQEIEAYLEFKRALLGLIAEKPKREMITDSYMMSFFIGYRNELDLAKTVFIQAVVITAETVRADRRNA